MEYKLGELVSSITIIKDGVDLKDRFYDIFDNHPLTYAWSDSVKKMISIKLFDEVMKDANKWFHKNKGVNNESEVWRLIC